MHSKYHQDPQRPSVTNSSRGVKILILNREKMREKISYEFRDYEAGADAPQSNTI